MDMLRCNLHLDLEESSQELTVWIAEQNGQLVAGYVWSNQQYSFRSSGLPLKVFLPGVQFPYGEGSVENWMNDLQLSSTLTGPALAWIRQQAEARLGKKGDL
jgi:hypothetical protein